MGRWLALRFVALPSPGIRRNFHSKAHLDVVQCPHEAASVNRSLRLVIGFTAATFIFGLLWFGLSMEVHQKFPARANIVFVKVLDRENIELKIWERGAGETSASGTCSTGAAILSAFRGETGRRVSVHTEGGITEITWREDDEMLILGRADFVFDGEYP